VLPNKFPKELDSTYSRHLTGVLKYRESLFSFISITLKPDFLNSESSSTVFTGALKSAPSSMIPASLSTSFAIIYPMKNRVHVYDVEDVFTVAADVIAASKLKSYIFRIQFSKFPTGYFDSL